MYFNTLKGDKKGPCPGSPAVEQACSGHPGGRRSQKVPVDVSTRTTASLLDHTWHTEDNRIFCLNCPEISPGSLSQRQTTPWAPGAGTGQLFARELMEFSSSSQGSPPLPVLDGARNDKKRGLRPQTRGWNPGASPLRTATCWHRIPSHQRITSLTLAFKVIMKVYMSR